MFVIICRWCPNQIFILFHERQPFNTWKFAVWNATVQNLVLCLTTLQWPWSPSALDDQHRFIQQQLLSNSRNYVLPQLCPLGVEEPHSSYRLIETSGLVKAGVSVVRDTCKELCPMQPQQEIQPLLPVVSKRQVDNNSKIVFGSFKNISTELFLILWGWL